MKWWLKIFYNLPEGKTIQSKEEKTNKTLHDSWFVVKLLRLVQKSRTDWNSMFICFSTLPTKFLPLWHFCSFLRQLCRLASGFVSTISLSSCSSLSSHLFPRHRAPTFTSSSSSSIPHLRSRPFMLERRACGSMASMRLTDYCNSYTLISCTNH